MVGESGTHIPVGTRMAVQFQRLEAYYELPGSAALDDRTQALLLGTTAKVVGALRAEMREVVADAARRLLTSDEVRSATLALPHDLTLACVGDSLTADQQSWAEMVRKVLAATRPDVKLLNLGRSGDTSMDIVRRLKMALGERDAQWFVVFIGANDACRPAPYEGKMHVSDDETRANLQRIAEIVDALPAHLACWVTPGLLQDDIVAGFPVFQEMGIRYTSGDVDRKAQIVRERPEPVVDLHAALAGERLDRVLLPDGLHLSAAGQEIVARQALLQLALR